MKTKNLLNPRYQVIADYPDTPFSIGNIVEYDGVIFGLNEPQKFIRNPMQFPHIFQLLEWWERRQLNELPEYVKVVTDYKCSVSGILKVKQWHVWENRKIPQGLFFATFEGKESNYDVQHFVPSNEKEYLSNAAELQVVSK